MAKAGLGSTKTSLIFGTSDLKVASEIVGYPAIIKPVNFAASIGVVRVDSFEDLVQKYSRVLHEVKSARIVSGSLEQGDEDPKVGGNVGNWVDVRIMLEEYFDGPEVDIDIVLNDGRVIYAKVSDNWPTIEPYFNETGSNAPSTLSQSQQAELTKLGVDTVKTLGFSCGVFHVEGKYTSRGARLIEVNCRMGGGPVHMMNQLVWGVCLVEEQLLCSAGLPSQFTPPTHPLTYLAEYSVNALQSGTLQDTKFLDVYQKETDVLYARPLTAAGSKVVCAKNGLPTWVCELMVKGQSSSETIERIKKFEQEIQAAIVIKPISSNVG
jgi:carnosine synthase